MSSQTGEWAHSLTFSAKDSAHRRRHQSDGEDNVYSGSSVQCPRACLAHVLRWPEVGEAATTRRKFQKNELHTLRLHERAHEKQEKNAFLVIGRYCFWTNTDPTRLWLSQLLGWIRFFVFIPQIECQSIVTHWLTLGVMLLWPAGGAVSIPVQIWTTPRGDGTTSEEYWDRNRTDQYPFVFVSG